MRLVGGRLLDAATGRAAAGGGGVGAFGRAPAFAVGRGRRRRPLSAPSAWMRPRGAEVSAEAGARALAGGRRSAARWAPQRALAALARAVRAAGCGGEALVVALRAAGDVEDDDEGAEARGGESSGSSSSESESESDAPRGHDGEEGSAAPLPSPSLLLAAPRGASVTAAGLAKACSALGVRLRPAAAAAVLTAMGAEGARVPVWMVLERLGVGKSGPPLTGTGAAGHSDDDVMTRRGPFHPYESGARAKGGRLALYPSHLTVRCPGGPEQASIVADSRRLPLETLRPRAVFGCSVASAAAKAVWAAPGGAVAPAGSFAVISRAAAEGGARPRVQQRYLMGGHSFEVCALALSECRTLATTADDGLPPSIAVWDVASGSLLQRFDVDSGARARGLVALALAPDRGELLVAVAADLKHTISVWRWRGELGRPTLVARAPSLQGIPPAIFGLNFDLHSRARKKSVAPTAVFATLGVRHLRMWELTEVAAKSGSGTALDLTSKSLSFAGAPLATLVSALFLPGGRPAQRRPWECAKRRRHGEARASPRLATAALLTGTSDGQIYVWQDRRCTRRVQAHSRHVGGLALSPCGTLLASGSADGSVRCWAVRDGSLADGGALCELRLSASGVPMVGGELGVAAMDCFAGDAEERLIAATAGGAVLCLKGVFAAARLAPPPRGDDGPADVTAEVTTQALVEGHAASALAVAACPTEEDALYTLTEAGTLAQWDAARCVCVSRVGLAADPLHAQGAAPGDETCCLAVAPDGQRIAAASAASGLVVTLRADPSGKPPLSVATRAAELNTRRAGEPPQLFCALAWSPSGEALAAGLRDGRVAVYGAGLTLRFVCDGLSARVASIDWARDGSAFMVSSNASEVVVFDGETGRQCALAGDTGGPSLSRHSDWTTWSSAVGFPVMGVGGALVGASRVRASHGRRLLALCGGGGGGDAAKYAVQLVRFPSVVAKAPRTSFGGHGGRVRDLAFGVGDRSLVSVGGTDRTAIVWRVEGDDGDAGRSESEASDEDEIVSFVNSIDASLASLDLDETTMVA